MPSFDWSHLGHFIARIWTLLLSWWGYGPAFIVLSAILVLWRFIRELQAYYQARYNRLNWRVCKDIIQHASQKVRLSWEAKLTAAAWIILLTVAGGYVVWKDHSTLVYERNTALSFDISNQTELSTLRNEVASLKTRLSSLSQVPEPPDSLRRRAKRLADEIDDYVSDRNSHYPVPTGNDAPNATPEEKAQRKVLNAYFEETTRTCNKRFGASWREIVQQLKGHGIPTHAGQFNDLDWAFREDQEQPQCPNPQQTGLLRDLAYRLDATGNPIHF